MPTPIHRLLEKDYDAVRLTPCEQCIDWEVEPGSPEDLAHLATCAFNQELVSILSLVEAAEVVPS